MEQTVINRDGIKIGKVGDDGVYRSRAKISRYFTDYRNSKFSGYIFSVGEGEGIRELGGHTIRLDVGNRKVYEVSVETFFKHRLAVNGKRGMFYVLPNKHFEVRSI